MRGQATGKLVWVTAVVAVCLGSCSTPPLPITTSANPTIGKEVELAPLTLGPNDVLRVTVYGHPELSTPPEGTRIDPEGKLILPHIGSLHVEGQNLEKVQARVHKEMLRFVRRPSVAVTVREYGAHRFYVLGQIKDPGPYEMDRHLTALQALSSGGGFETSADRDRIVLLRPQSDGLEAHVFSADTPDDRAMVYVQPNDILFVRRTGTGRFREEIMPYIQALTGVTGSGSSFFLSVQTAKQIDGL